MRSLFAVLAAAGGFALLSAEAQACSARGTFCGHPEWAANAFEGPRGSHAKGQVNLKHLHGYGHGYDHEYAYRPVYVPVYVGKKHHHKKHW